MSTKQMEQVRDESLARRLKLAMGGIPTLALVTADERPTREALRRQRALRACQAVYGVVR